VKERPKIFTWPRAILAAILLFALAVWAVPKYTEGMFRNQLIQALEDGLGRKVEIGQVSFRILPTPGFAIDAVRIGEDPAVGSEPFAWVGTLVARPAFLPLLAGRFAIGSVRLEDASLNLTRIDTEPAGVRWNFTLFTSKTGDGAAKASAFPSIHMTGGRINFKFGETKSIFYLHDTDVDLSPSATPGGPLDIRVTGQPARTDKPSRGFGSFVANGQWNSSDHSLELNVQLEKSELSDVLSLFEGGKSTLLGNIWGDAHLAGPMSHIGISGRLNVSDLHGWNQLPPGGNAWPFTIGGTINAPGQRIELQASGAGKPSPIGARLSVADYLGRPRWDASVSLDGVPVAPLTGIARNFGIALPTDLTLDGIASGSIGYLNISGMQGQVRVSNATLAAQGAPPLKIAMADVMFAGSAISLSPTSIVNDASESATIDGRYDIASGDFQVTLTSSGMAIASLRRQVSVAGAPLLGLATSGIWSGSLRYDRPPAGVPAPGWTGDIHLKDTDIPFEAFAQPIHVLDADASIDSDGAVVKHLSMTVGGIAAQGEYRYETGAKHPHRFRIWLPSADAEDLEAVLVHALSRGSILAYAFNFGRVPEPGWLHNMHAEGSIEAGLLAFAGTRVAGMKTNLVWDGTDVNLTGLTGRLADGTFAGDATIHLAGRQPRYEMNGTLLGLPWQGGTLTATGALTTSGMGVDLLSNLKAEGTFTGRKLEIAPLNPWDSVEGRFDFAVARTTPKLRLSMLNIQSAGTRWTGAGETLDSGQIVVKVADGARHMEASGALLQGEALKPLP
jgi:hypothetical protein